MPNKKTHPLTNWMSIAWLIKIMSRPENQCKLSIGLWVGGGQVRAFLFILMEVKIRKHNYKLEMHIFLYGKCLQKRKTELKPNPSRIFMKIFHLTAIPDVMSHTLYCETVTYLAWAGGETWGKKWYVNLVPLLDFALLGTNLITLIILTVQ